MAFEWVGMGPGAVTMCVMLVRLGGEIAVTCGRLRVEEEEGGDCGWLLRTGGAVSWPILVRFACCHCGCAGWVSRALGRHKPAASVVGFLWPLTKRGLDEGALL